MKTKNIIRYSLLVVLFAGTFSCSKKLEEDPISFVSPDKFYNSPQQVESAYAASMNFLWDYWSGYSYGYGSFINDDQYYTPPDT